MPSATKMWMVTMNGKAVPEWIYGGKKKAAKLAEFLADKNPKMKFEVVPVLVTWGGKEKGK